MSRASSILAIFLCSLVPAVCQTTPTSSAKDDNSQEAFIFDRIENHISFEDDGTGLRDTTAVIRIQSQAALQDFGQLVFGYSAATEKLEIKYVRVRKPDGKVVETSTADAQDFAPDVLKEAPMYSDYRERHVSVASLQPGDILEYRTVVQVTPLAPHEFWYEHTFPKEAVVHEDILEITVPKARAIKLKSPKSNYETKEAADRRVYTWTIKDFKPERKREREEIDEEDFHPDVQVSSFTDWQQVSQWYSKLQSDRANPDDAIRIKAAELTKGAKTPEEKTRRLYDYVAQNIRYVSLSFGVGRLQPHPAVEVLQNGYGDCKDKHTLLQSLLRAQQIQSYPVLINSFRRLDTDVPSPGQFDHVITAVSLGPEFTWLDSTAEVAPYGLIFYQLRGKDALLASADAKGGLIRTPLEAPMKNTLTVDMDGSFTESGSFEMKIDLTARGDSDAPLRMAFRQTPQPRWEQLAQVFSRSWGLLGDVSEIHVDPLQDTTKPFRLSFRLRNDAFFRVPSSSTDFRLLPPLALIRARNTDPKDSAAPVLVGPAEEFTYRAHIRFPSNYTVHLPSAVKMSRDYGEYSSSYALDKNVLIAERRLLLKVSELPAARRFDYESFRNAAGNETEQLMSATVTTVAGSSSPQVATTESSPAELQKLGAAALQRRDFAAAVDLLKRAVNTDAERKDAWDQLGLAYAGLNRHDDAIAAFRKQIEVDQNHKSANADLAEELQKEGKLNDAADAYKKQIEISPYDKRAHKDLGLLYSQMKRDPDARTELEAAAAIPPDDPEVTAALAQVYSRTGSPEKAASLMNALTGATGATAGPDLFAAALRDDVNPDQTIRDARQTLDQIGDQFDSGEYDRLTPAAFSSMNLVALAWARMGWAKFLQNETLDGMQFLNSAWLLSQSSAVGNRLGRLFQKEGQQEKARHMFSLAAAANGPEAVSSREQVNKLSTSPEAANQEIAKASAELSQMRTVRLSPIAGAKGSAQFALVFETSSKPSRAEFLEGDSSLRPAGDKLREKEFSVRFPEISSVKLVRHATVTCDSSACTAVLEPLETLTTTQGVPAASTALTH